MQKYYIETPLLFSTTLSEIAQTNIYLKMEALQPSGSFKDRGMTHLCQYYAAKGIKGFASSSGGNAGISVATVGKKLGLAVKVFVPQNALPLCINRMLKLGAEVTTVGETWDQADLEARKLATELNYAYIPPFDHPKIWEGYTSIIDEFQKDQLQPNAIIVSVGGGGLFSGLTLGLKQKGWLQTALITAETKGAATLATSFQKKQRIILEKIDTIAGTLGAKQICQEAFDQLNTFPLFPQVVSDSQAVKACLRFADDHRLLVEPACGAALSVVYDQTLSLKSYRNVVVIICGGNGVSLELLKRWQDKFGIDA